MFVRSCPCSPGAGEVAVGLGEAYSDSPALRVHVSWRTGTNPALEFTFGGDGHDGVLRLGLGFVAFWFSVSNVIPRSWRARSWAAAQARALRYKTEDRRRSLLVHRAHYAHELDPLQGRRSGVRVFDGSIWIELWHNDCGWRHNDQSLWPWEGWGWTWTLPVVDWLLGARKHTSEHLRGPMTVPIRVPAGHGYPETDYLAEVEFSVDTWTRARWPWSRVESVGVIVAVPSGVPHPGKGTDAHNCDEDALYSMSRTFDSPPSPEMAAQLFVDRVLHYRATYPL